MDPTSTQPQNTPPVKALSRTESTLIALAIVVGIGLRFYTRSALWLDEALSVNIAAVPMGDIPAALRHDGHPPLYYFLLHIWMSIFGEGDNVVRALSGFISLATLPVVFFITKAKRGLATATLATMALALLPYMLRYSTEARMYSLIVFLVALGWLFILRLIDRANLANAIGLSLITAALLYTHYWSIWLLATVGLGALWLAWKAIDPQLRRSARYAIAALVAGGVLFLPWLPSLVDQLAHTGTPWGTRQRPTATLAITLTDLVGGNLVTEGLFSALVVVILLLLSLTAHPDGSSGIVVRLATVAGIRIEFVVAAAALALGMLITFATGGAYASRYAAFIVPVVAVALAYGLVAFPGGLPRTLALLVTVVALGTTSVLGVDDQRTQARQAASIINDQATPNDVVLVCPDQLGPALTRQLNPGPTVLAYPTLDSPERIDWRDYATRNQAANPVTIVEELQQQAGDHAIWLVWMGGYTTFDEQCETVRAQLMATRAIQPLLVPAPEEFFEPMALDRFLAP